MEIHTHIYIYTCVCVCVVTYDIEKGIQKSSVQWSKQLKLIKCRIGGFYNFPKNILTVNGILVRQWSRKKRYVMKWNL